jgi:hypothetical protein
MKILVTESNGYIGSTFIDLEYIKYPFEKFSLLNQKFKDINFDNVDAVLHCAALVHQKIEHSYEKYHEVSAAYYVKLVKVPFFEALLKLLKPSFHKRLYGNLEVDNTITKQKLNLKNPYSVEEGIGLMTSLEQNKPLV